MNKNFLESLSTYSPKLDYRDLLELLLTLKAYMIDNNIKNLIIDDIEIKLNNVKIEIEVSNLSQSI